MIAGAALAPSNPIARLTSAAFALIPAWLPLLILRLALARPFFASGLTRWDGWFTLSFGAKTLFAEEYKLHIFGAEIPFPAPELVATMASTAEIVLPILLAFGFLTRWDGWFTLSFGAKTLFAEEYKLHVFGAEIPFPAPELVATMASTAEIVLPILLAFGFLTRWAALGLLVMTGVIQLTYPDGWANFHLYWAALALAIMTFGPGAISLDRLIGLEGSSAGSRPHRFG
jgi:putative oxidoreductase